MKEILVIEDDKSIANLERDYLEFHQYKVTVVHSGSEGLSLALSSTFNLIILDVMLPDMDGFTICERIRETKDTPILMVTAKKEDIDVIKGLGLGADDYLLKPFNPNHLIARVNAHINRYERLTNHQAVPSEIYQFGRLVVNCQARRVYVDDVSVELRAKEYALLLLFMHHPGQVFSKDHLYERIWGSEAFGDVSTVTVHIKKLRDKLMVNDQPFTKIETIWGVGYRFNNDK